jgi:uncharacterized membrane protein
MLNRIFTLAALTAGGVLLVKQIQKKSRTTADHSAACETIDVDLPVRTCYDQWTQFEDFPQFMESVHEVRQLDDRHLHWRAEVWGKAVEWDAEITEQIPDQKISWRSIAGPRNGGTVSFTAISPTRTRIALALFYAPQGPMERVGDALGSVGMEARRNLRRFKENLERRGQETGAWRGAVSHPPAGQTHCAPG